MPLFFTPAGRLSGWPMESEKRQAPWVAQLTATHLLLQRPHLLFSENKERTFKLTCAARHRAQTLHHRKAKPGGNSGIFEITKPDLRKATAFKKLADSWVKEGGDCLRLLGEKNTRQQPAALLRGRWPSVTQQRTAGGHCAGHCWDNDDREGNSFNSQVW